MDQIANKVSNIVDVVDLLDEVGRKNFDTASYEYINDINKNLVSIDKILIQTDIENINVGNLSQRKEKILNQCLFIVYWHLHNKLENLDDEQIEKIEGSKNKLSNCLQHVGFE